LQGMDVMAGVPRRFRCVFACTAALGAVACGDKPTVTEPDPVAVTFDTAAVTAQLQRSVAPFNTGTPYVLIGMLSYVAAKTGTVPGTTYVWDPDSLGYVASSLTGAPGNAVRYMLYRMTYLANPRPVVPLEAIGYLDAIIRSTGAVRVVELTFVGTTGPTPVAYWHATVTHVSGASWSTDTVMGSFTSGTSGIELTSADSVSFPNVVSATRSVLVIDPATGARLRLQRTTGPGSPPPYTLTTRYAYSVALGSDSLDASGTIDLMLLPGELPTTSTSLAVAVNGRLFGLLGYDENGRLRATDPRRQPLPPAAEAAAVALFELPDAVWGVVQTVTTAAVVVQ
jgi:hypothetical protein